MLTLLLAAALPADTVHLAGIPHVQQEPDFCGEACLEMALRWKGLDVDQDAVFGLTGLDPALGRGAWTRDLQTAAEALGYDVGPVWSYVEGGGSMEPQWQELLADLEAGVPSIVCMNTEGGTEHFRLVVGYDADRDEVIYNEPAARRGLDARMDRAHFLAMWPLKYDRATWTVVRLPLRDKGLHVPAAEPHPSRAALARAVMVLREQAPDDFTMVVEPPFVVLGDEDAATVEKRAAGTVRWAAEQLRSMYFEDNPEGVWAVWLFRDERSYRGHAAALWSEDPDTPYGYASGEHHALVMNIATGGGTLIHEMVHPFIAANLPGCPPWFNEGLASLYEQAGVRDGRMVGLVNWRLPDLQTAILDDDVPSFERLMSYDSEAFYLADPGTNYAQARYLCLYLQEQGLLHFTASVRRHHRAGHGGAHPHRHCVKTP